MEPHNHAVLRVSKQFGWVYLKLQRLIDRSLSKHEASLAKIRLLTYIAEGPRRSTDVASFFGQAPRTVTQAIDALEASGHLRRVPVPDDRRAKFLELTAVGQMMLAHAEPLYEKVLVETVGSLDASDLAHFAASLAKVEAAVEQLEKPTP